MPIHVYICMHAHEEDLVKLVTLQLILKLLLVCGGTSLVPNNMYMAIHNLTNSIYRCDALMSYLHGDSQYTIILCVVLKDEACMLEFIVVVNKSQVIIMSNTEFPLPVF